MPPRDPNIPQLDFPALVSDIITQLQVRGQIGLLNLQPSVQPIYIAAAREGLTLGTFSPPIFNSASVFSGRQSNPASGTVVVDTLALPAGTYDLLAGCNADADTASADGMVNLEHRNAANTATLAIVQRLVIGDPTRHFNHTELPLIGYSIAENERFRWITAGTTAQGGATAAYVILRLRPAP